MVAHYEVLWYNSNNLVSIGVHPDYSDDKYNIKEMVLTWICYNVSLTEL